MDASHEESKRWSSLESREPELNQAIVEVSREDFLVGNFDLESLFVVGWRVLQRRLCAVARY